ncbi:MAG: hypothetical protein M1825_003149 [Sarcosagium campestre]|nr:MAG: hypothetical protein M1825_003149 [Sarcosagium campestre]
MSPAKEPHIAHTLLSTLHPQETADRLFTEKVLRRPLNLVPTTTSTPSISARDRRRALQESRRRPKGKSQPLTAKAKRQLGIYDLPRRFSSAEVASFKGMHQLWCGYAREVLQGAEGPALAQRVCSADLHGAKMTVVRSRCVSRVRVSGIVIREGRGVFVLVDDDGAAKTVPKEHTVFRVEVPSEDDARTDLQQRQERQSNPMMVFEIHGEQFICRPAERAVKKFKARNLIDL